MIIYYPYTDNLSVQENRLMKYRDGVKQKLDGNEYEFKKHQQGEMSEKKESRFELEICN